ncbi:MAG TPA: HIT family protein [Actinomycetota bacterium]|nr:HIT family protein [Actinomycetota bacterium]
MDPDCIFCKIIAGEAPATRLYEDDATVCFLDIFPWARGHSLVVSKEHAETIYDLSESAAAATMATVKIVAPILRDAVGAEGLNLLQANGRAAWQSVDHFHIHLVPRWFGDPLRPPGAPSPADPDALKEIAASFVERLS